MELPLIKGPLLDRAAPVPQLHPVPVQHVVRELPVVPVPVLPPQLPRTILQPPRPLPDVGFLHVVPLEEILVLLFDHQQNVVVYFLCILQLIDVAELVVAGDEDSEATEKAFHEVAFVEILWDNEPPPSIVFALPETALVYPGAAPAVPHPILELPLVLDLSLCIVLYSEPILLAVVENSLEDQAVVALAADIDFP